VAKRAYKPRKAARGSREAKRQASHERYVDGLYDRGVLTRPEFAREIAQAAQYAVEQIEQPEHSAYTLVIDAEFESLIPPQTEEENAALETSILREGCRDALVVWQDHNILVDGHNRYAICKRHGLSYVVREREFASREDVIVWMVQNQLARRNIVDFMKTELVLRMKSAIEAKKKANQLSGLKQGTETPVPQMFAERGETREELGKTANVSRETVRKVEKVLSDAPEPIKKKARSGHISTSRAYLMTQALKGADPQIVTFVTEHDMDDAEKVEILKRLHKSAGSPESNGTFDEIMAKGEFHYDEGKKQSCNFVTANVQQIQRSLDALAAQHARIAMDEKRYKASQTPLPTGKYRCIVIDPPWPVEKIVREVRPNQGEHLDYPTMTLEEIAALPIGDLAYEDGCHLYLWTTQKHLPNALALLAGWDFKYQCVMTWVKPTGMTPYSWMYNTELVLFARRGNLALERNGLKLSFDAPSEGHSIKPDVFYQRVVEASPSPRLDMFARRTRKGFDVFGDEVDAS
jgi:N6-adenosine-specific RNA methylase IME4/ParB-like chromosome segregation protein Spo0J